ncbi:MAG: acetylglutamate kinase [Desulfobacterales bacterium]
MQSRILIKIGGRAFVDEPGFKDLAAAIKSTRESEIVIVHGGGAEISQALKEANRKTEFIDGIRVTHAEDIKIVEAVLSDTINPRIVSWLKKSGVICRSLSGKSRQLFIVKPLTRKGRELGFVGTIESVNPEVVLESLKAGQVPVVSPISADEMGQSYNVNADSAAAALAGAIHCTDLVFFTDVPGVLVDDQLQSILSAQKAQLLIASGIIKGGMVAKIESAFEALQRQVPRVHIVKWQGSQTLSNIITGKPEAGTTIAP